MGITEGTTGVPQNRINSSMRRSILRILPSLDERDVVKDGTDGLATSLSVHRSTSAAASRSDGKQELSFLPDIDEFHAKVRVGAMIEAEMDDTKGSTEWVVGQVQSVDAARATFTVKFTVQSDTETGEWIDQYRWEELGREWRFAQQEQKLVSDRDRRNESRRLSAEDAGGVDGSAVNDMLPGKVVEVKSERYAISCHDDEFGAAPDEDLAESRVRPGVTVEAWMESEWIRGVVISTKSKSGSFKVQFKVTDDDECREWTDEYR